MLGIRQQHATNTLQREHVSQRSEFFCDTANVKPPLGVQTFLLCAVKISLMFSSLKSTRLVPQKRSRSESDNFTDFFDNPVMPICGMLTPAACDEQRVDVGERHSAISQSLCSESCADTLDDDFVALLSMPKYATSEEIFADLFCASGDNSDDSANLVFSSQGSTLLQLQDTPPEATLSLEVPSMNGLMDGVLRNIICAKPIRMASGIRMETSTLKARLADIAPSTFSPGYTEAAAARAPLVPTIARFLTSFLRKTRRSSVATRNDELQSEKYSEGSDQSRDEETKLKEMVKKNLWMTMTNKLRNPEPARRLKPLQSFAKSSTLNSDDLLDIEDTAKASGWYGITSDREMLQEDLGACIATTRYQIGDDDGMLDFDEDEDEDDEQDGYEHDLFAVYEKRRRNCLDQCYTNDFRPVLGGNNDCLERASAFDGSESDMLSPFLEFQGERLQLGSAEQPATTVVTQIIDVSSAATPGEAILAPNVITDVTSTNLLDEESPSESPYVRENENVSQPSPLIEDEWEQDFEQWEFDVEQGSEEMLF